MLFSYYIGSPRKICLLHHSTWFGFSTWCDDILSNVRIQQFVKSAKTFFFPFFTIWKFFYFLISSIIGFVQILLKILTRSLLVSRRLYYKPFRNWEGKNCIATWWMYPMIFCKTQCIIFFRIWIFVLKIQLKIFQLKLFFFFFFNFWFFNF